MNVDSIKQALQALPEGRKGVDAAESEWATHASSALPVVTLYGPYSAGKSALLKRLLVEEGHEIPEWLSVSGDPETFEVRTVDVAGCRVRDTPGLQAGVSLHQDQAAQTLQLSDAILVLLPPQLMTAGRDALLDVVSGRFFHPEGLAYPPEGLVLAVTQFDTAGVDPLSDAAGYETRAAAKRDELQASLVAAKVENQPSLPFHVVSADPYGAVDDRRDVGRSEYEPYSSWDGVAALRERLESLHTFLPELRSAAEARFWSLRAIQALDALDVETTRLSLAAGEAQSQVERKRIFMSELDSLVDAARKALDGIVEEQMLSVARRGVQNQDDVQALVANRVADALNRWATSHDAQVTDLARKLAVEVEARAAQPGAEAFRKLFEPTVATHAEGIDPKIWSEVASETGDGLQQAFQRMHERRIGMSFSDAQSEILKFNSLRSGDLEDYFQGPGGFRSPEQAASAQTLVNRHATATAAGNALMALAPLLIEFVGEHREAKRREEARVQLRTDVRTAAEGVALAYFNGDEALGVIGWTKRADDVRTAIEGIFRLHEAAAAELPRTIADLQVQAEILHRALTD